MNAMPVTFDDVRGASARLAGVAHRTPVLTSRTLDDLAGAKVFVKCENFQRVGAFKFRGAYNALSQLSADERKRGVLTWSSGNHAQAVALSGRLLGIPTTIVMPSDSPAIKMQATREYGAEVVAYDRNETVREELGTRIATERGMAIVPPYDHAHVIAGQGTAAMELLEETGPLDFLFVPLGGGGLLSGCSIAMNSLSPGGAVYGVEPATADDGARSFHSGVLQSIHNPPTIADGARTPSLGKLTFAIIQQFVKDVVTVPDEALVRAMRFCFERMKIVVEPTGTLGIAGILEAGVDVKGARVGVIVSGGNVDLGTFGELVGK